MDIQKELKSIIIAIARNEVTDESISNETVLTNDLGFDSVQIVSLIVEIESYFGIVIDDEDLDLDKISVFGSLIELVTKKVS